MEAAIKEHRSKTLLELREARVRRIEEEAEERAVAYRVAQRDRERIKEARERRIQEKQEQARKTAEEKEAARLAKTERATLLTPQSAPRSLEA